MTPRASTVLVTALVAVAHAQEPQAVAFPGVAQRLTNGFTSIDAVRELRDGRVVVIDSREREAFLGDFASARVDALARRGAGPLEYSQPRGAFSLRDGSILIQDPGNARFLRLDSDGRAVGAWQPGPGRGRNGATLDLSVSWDVRATDAQGRLYFEQLPGQIAPDHDVRVPIVRLDVGTGDADTVASYTLTSAMQTFELSRGSSGEMIVRPRAWPARPEWTVTPEGMVALVTSAPYRVTWFRSGQPREGPVVPVAPVRVDASDRDAFQAAAERAVRGPSSTAKEPARSAGAAPPTRKVGGAPVFPEVMPPFSGRNAVAASPDGRVWVSRTRNARDAVQVVDVFDPEGRRESRVALPPNRRLVGFSDRYAYLAFRDADDLEFLERYPARSR